MYRYFVIILVAIFDQVVAQDGPTETCEYEHCPKYVENVINVHVVPHSHNDVGWLRTPEEYYDSTVRKILDSVVKELGKDPMRKFTYVESYYFFKWWDNQTEEVKNKVRVLVKEGRLQFAGGGWTMNDEATTNYQSIIDQFTYGLNKISDTFGPCAAPRVAWQIDTFGHSREFASLLAAMGFHGQILARVDYQDKEYRKATKTMEVIWRSDDSLGNASDIYTGILYDMYWPPHGFCFDTTCDDKLLPEEDSKRNKSNSFARMMRRFSGEMSHRELYYKYSNMLVPMGHDFHYQDGEKWFTSLDKIIRYFTKLKGRRHDIKIYYSTPQCYLKALRDSQCRNISTVNPWPYRHKREAWKETLQHDRNPYNARNRKFPPHEDEFYSYVGGKKFPMKGHSGFPNAESQLFPTNEDGIPPNARLMLSMKHGEFPTFMRGQKPPQKYSDRYKQRDNDYIYAKDHDVYRDLIFPPRKDPSLPPDGLDSEKDAGFGSYVRNQNFPMTTNFTPPHPREHRRPPYKFGDRSHEMGTEEEDDFYSFVRGQKLPMKGNFTGPRARFPMDDFEDDSNQKGRNFPAGKDDSNSYERDLDGYNNHKKFEEDFKKLVVTNNSFVDELKKYFKSQMFDVEERFGGSKRDDFREKGSTKLPMKYDDFFPYASSVYSYWTGYYTSRPSLKYFERQTNTYLQMVKHLQVLGNLTKDNMLVLDELKSAMGIMQHHEAITGTSKQNVTDDYVRTLSKAVADAHIIPREAFRKFFGGGESPRALEASLSFTSCRLNESSCSVSETSNQFVVTVYNPLAWHVNEPIRIPVLDKEFDVYDPHGQVIPSQLVAIPEAVLDIPTRVSVATHEIIFIAKLEPLSYSNYYIK